MNNNLSEQIHLICLNILLQLNNIKNDIHNQNNKMKVVCLAPSGKGK